MIDALISEPRTILAGGPPISAPGASIRYDGPGLDVALLKAGSPTRSPMSQTVQGSSGGQIASGRVEATPIGCGVTTAAAPGAPNEPVRVYRLVIPTLSPSSTCAPEPAEMERLVSTRTGWRVAQRSPRGLTVLAATDDARSFGGISRRPETSRKQMQKVCIRPH
nr:hypothetical protein [uncultured Brevundimonas sp.]